MHSERVAKSFCRICQGFCGVVVTIAEDRVVKVRGDRDDPLSRGYACFKGLQAPEQHYGDGRLMHSLERRDGQLVAGCSDDILANAGARLAEIVTTHGPGAVGFFMGTQSLFNTLDPAMIGAFAAGLGTPRLFGTMTIDQSAKWIGEGRLGTWEAGPQPFAGADVWMVIGSNPLVSMVAAGGANQFAFSDPVKVVKAARAKGLKLIVIDPRRSETAEFADLFLQPRPGKDALLVGSILHVILARGWIDRDFCHEHADGLESLQQALASFAPDARAKEIGVTASEIEQAAAMFARDARSGMAGSGTGPNMARHSNLAEHLIQVINVVCGRFPRDGDMLANPGVLKPRRAVRAQVSAARREWESGPKTVAHGLGPIHGTMMSAEIADEILHDGAGRLRAMICVGGNLAVALPDQKKAMAALAALDLLIVIDPRLSATAQLADYVIAPTLQYERPDHTGFLEGMFQTPFGHATGRLVPPPLGSDVVNDWYALWSLAKSTGVQLTLGAPKLSMEQPPTAEDLLALLATGSNVPFAEVVSADGGAIFAVEPTQVQPRANDARFQLLPADVAKELAELAAEPAAPDTQNGHFQLIVRRHRELMNSTGSDLAATWQRMPGNPAYLNPGDIEMLGLQAGDEIEIARDEARISARLVSDTGLRRGVLSIGHCWPGFADRPLEATNALVDATNDVQAINRMPVMTGMTVTISRRDQGAKRALYEPERTSSTTSV